MFSEIETFVPSDQSTLPVTNQVPQPGATVKKRPGRPKGSKNKPKAQAAPVERTVVIYVTKANLDTLDEAFVTKLIEMSASVTQIGGNLTPLTIK